MGKALSNFSAYNARFKMPSDPSGGNSNMWYSFDAGPVHFVSLDLETAYPGAAEEKRYVFKSGGFYGDMVQWLEDDLKKVNRSERPWVFVSGHHPMYAEGAVNADMQAALEGLFHQYGVDVMFAGHVHHYERDYPIYQGQVESTSYVDPTATVHFLVGGAGNDEMDDDQRRLVTAPEEGEEEFGSEDSSSSFPAAAYSAGSPPPSSAVEWVDPSREVVHRDNARIYVNKNKKNEKPDLFDQSATAKKEGADNDDNGWIAFEDYGFYGASVVKVHNDTHMHFRYVRTTSGEVADEVWIVKNQHRQR